MSIQDFINNPLAYTKGHVVQFSHQAGDVSPAASGMQVTQVINNWGGNWTAEEYQQIPGQFTDFTFFGDTNTLTGEHVRIGKGSRAMHSICCRVTNVEKHIRFLPWKANTVTFMQIDGAGETFFTGPLSGCSIFIGLDAGNNYWGFHANRNNAGAHNAAIKTSMTINTIGSMAGPVRVVHSAVYQQQYHDLGFVFGQRRGGRWRFYVADTRATGGGKFATTVQELA